MEVEASCEALVAAVKKRPSVYDKYDKGYSNRALINALWREIGEEIGVSEVVARRKWTCLRDYFQKQCRQNAGMKRGPWPSKKRKWYLFDSLSFLQPHVSLPSGALSDEEKNPTGDAVDDDDDTHSHASSSSAINAVTKFSSTTTSTTDVISDSRAPHFEDWNGMIDKRIESIDMGTKSPPRKKPRYMIEEDQEISSQVDIEMLETLKEMRERMSQPKVKEEDEDELFFKSLIPKVKSLDLIAKMECEHEILSVVLSYMKRNSGSQISALKPTPGSESEADKR